MRRVTVVGAGMAGMSAAFGAKAWSMMNDAFGTPDGDYFDPWMTALRNAKRVS